MRAGHPFIFFPCGRGVDFFLFLRFFIIFGVNPLFLYVLSEVLAIMMGSTRWKAAAYAAIHSGITDAYLASAVYALVFTLFLGCIGYPLYLKKIYIKL